MSILKINAEFLLQSGKGILAADENPSSMIKRFKSIHVENTDEQRRIYRQILLTTMNLSQYISGVIMHEETFNQTDDSSQTFPLLLSHRGILPGIKLDRGLESLIVNRNETTTLGFDDLHRRCDEFFQRGARFAKYRTVFRIDRDKNQPSQVAILNNAMILARFASICQSKGLVPMIEPEVISDGDHDLQVCQVVTEDVLSSIFQSLSDYDVYLEGCLLKTNMITPGREAKKNVKPAEIALATITTLRRTCPAALAGIVFLSGGQSEEDATVNLNAISQLSFQTACPWPLTFAFGRALQASALRAWNGKRENESIGQENLFRRAAANAAAANGKYQSKNRINEATKDSYHHDE